MNDAIVLYDNMYVQKSVALKATCHGIYCSNKINLKMYLLNCQRQNQVVVFSYIIL